MSQPIKKQSKEFNEYECGNGPRPPVPGEESQMSKMTTEGACGFSHTDPSPESQDPFSVRATKWQNSFDYLLTDKEGLDLLLKFVKEEDGANSINSRRLELYFACEGLKAIYDREPTGSIDKTNNTHVDNMRTIRKMTRLISTKYLSQNIIDTTPELRKTISQIAKNEIEPIRKTYDDLQKIVEPIIANTIYPAFLQSDVFIQYISQNSMGSADASSELRAMQASCSSLASCSSSDGAASFSRMTGLPPILSSSNLQTLHEDSELKISDEHILTKTTTNRPKQKLTRDLLLRTQEGRLEGAHGSPYSVALNSSFNPVSRQDSERQSCSSASLTDSEVNSKDGKAFFPRKPTAAEDYRRSYVNPTVVSQNTIIKPLAQGLKGSVQPTSESQSDNKSKPLDAGLLCRKLTALKQEQDKQERFNRHLADKLTSAQPRVFPAVEEDDQSILDQHVSRVFSPYLSPGTISPKHLQRYHRSHEMSTSMPEFVPQALRHSKSIPEHASSGSFCTTSKKLAQKWPSTNIDSGISLYSADLPYKTLEMKSIDPHSDDMMRKSSKDESRRLRKQVPLPLPQSQLNLMPTSSSHHTNSLTRQHEPSDRQEYTYAVYTFGDEKIPYRTKIPLKQLTLRDFKEYLPKKGIFRFFFTTACDDPDNPVIQEEVTNDMDLLPLYEGKVMGTLKPE